jgi:YVTN family beta-propeller protein
MSLLSWELGRVGGWRWVLAGARGWFVGSVVVLGLLVGAGPAGAATSHTAYVTHPASDSVTPIDTATNTPIAAIPVSGGPFAVAITPDGKTAYVTDSNSDSVTPIDTATNTPGAAITVGSFPVGVAITPDGKTAYVTNQFSSSVTPIDIATNTPGAAITVGSHPVGVAITPDGKTAYVVSRGSGSVTPIDTATNTPGAAITVGSRPIGVAITPDGKTAYVANEGSGSVTPIDTATNTPGAAIPVGSLPQRVAITPDGKTAYVTNAGSGSVTPIDTATNTPGAAITVRSPIGVAITPDGKTAYVTSVGSRSVIPIDTATNAPGAAIPVGSFPQGVAVTPDQGPVAAFSATAAPAGQASGFDASASSDPDGKVVSYHWNFGDGRARTTTSATTTHNYRTPGDHTVTLTVTDDAGCSTRVIFTGQTVGCHGSAAARVTHPLTVASACATPPPSGCYPDGVLGTAGLLAYWRLGEASGTIAHDALGAHNGTYTGGHTLGEPGALIGNSDTAVALNGTSGTVATRSLGSQTHWTIEGWTHLTNRLRPVPFGDNALYAGSTGVRLIVRPSGFYVDDWSNRPRDGVMQASTATNINRWVYWVLERSRSTLTLYRDGVEIAHSTLTAPGASKLDGTLGSQQGTKYFLHGTIDEVAVYKGALTPQTITHHYKLAGYTTP